MILYFSGCGNSRFVAESIAKALDERLLFVPEEERNGKFDYELGDGERLGFVFPIYSWCPPQLMLDYVKKLHFDRQPSYVWIAVTCGDNGGYADRVFRQQLEEIGLPMHADFCFQMPNTYVNMAGTTTAPPATPATITVRNTPSSTERPRKGRDSTVFRMKNVEL